MNAERTARARDSARAAISALTQAARIEFALAGGGVNTDFIDNAGGVDCSDHEVNLKILLNQLVADGDLTLKQRNQLLVEMTESVAVLVLTNNFRQAQALSIAERHARDRLTEYQRFISRMEVEQRLDRALEGVPTDDVLAERTSVVDAPELAVLLSYAKTHIKERLITSSIHADAVISETVFEEFPQVIRERYAVAARKHRLYREIVATIVANDVVHHLGISSVVHLSDFVGGEPRRNRACVLRRGALFRNPRNVSKHRVAGAGRRRDAARHAAADHATRATRDAMVAATSAQRARRRCADAAFRGQHRASVGVAARVDGRFGARTHATTSCNDGRARACRPLSQSRAAMRARW